MAFDFSFGDFPSFEYDLGDVANVATPNLDFSLPNVDTSSFLSDLGNQGGFSLSGPGYNPEAGGFNLGVGGGSGSAGMRLASEVSTPLGMNSNSGGGGGWLNWMREAFHGEGAGSEPGAKPYGVMDVLGDVGKVAAPFLSLGAAGMGIKSSMDAADRAARTEPVLREAQQTQVDSARAARALAPSAAAISPQIQAVAPRQGELSQQAAAFAGPQADLGRQILEGPAARQAETARMIGSSITTPQIQRATELLASARAGVLPEAEEAELQQQKTAALAKYRDYFARSGMGDSTEILKVEQMVDQQISAARADRLRKIEQNAMTFLNQANAASSTAGQLTESEGRLIGQAGNQNAAAVKALLDAGTITESQARILMGSAQPLGTAAQLLGTAGTAAQGAGASALAEEKSLNDLIAAAQAQIARMGSGAK